MGNDKFLTPTEVTDRLGISYSTFIRHIANDAIPHVRIGKQIRVPESFIDNLLNGSYDGWEVIDES